MKRNWYGFNHEVVDQKFEGGLTYITDFCINDEYQPVAVYKVAEPNRDKGHKDYLILSLQTKTSMIVRGLNEDEIQKYRYQAAVRCKNCQDVIYSVMRHDNRSCNCGRVSIDGGRDYCRLSFDKADGYVNGKIDHLTGEFTNEDR
jgi:hypothetical protein